MTNERLRRAAGPRTLRIGELTVSYVPDGALPLEPRSWFVQSTAEDWERYAEYLDDTGNLVCSLGTLLVEYGDRAMLIDAGLGPNQDTLVPGSPHGPGGALFDNLVRAGRSAADIEVVAITQLHHDHIGWSAHPRGLAEFADARYVVSRAEWEHRELTMAHGTPPEVLDALAPRVETAEFDEEIFPGVRLRSSIGHTAGHTTFEVGCGDERLLAIGDAMHSPLQIERPEWTAATDLDPAQATASRHALIEQLEHPGTIGFGLHFADVPFGRVVRNPTGPAWSPV